MKNFGKASKNWLAIVLVVAITLCSVMISLSVSADENEIVSFVLDASTNGGTVDGEGTKTVEAAAGEAYTSSAEMGTPDGQQFIGWSTDKDDYVGELTFTPKNDTTYYAIFGKVIYVDGTNGDTFANGADGSKEKPFKTFNKDGVPVSTFTNTEATNCVVVLSGTVTVSSISGYTAMDKRLYVTGKDPTTGELTGAKAKINQFALGIGSNAYGVFKKGVYLDYLTHDTTGDGQIYTRSTADFRLGKNFDGAGKVYITGLESTTVPWLYMDIAASNISNIQMQKRDTSGTVTGDATIVLNGGYIKQYDFGVTFPANVGGNLNAIVNDYDGNVLSFNTDKVTSVGGAINYIFNNGTLAKIKGTTNATLKFNWNYANSQGSQDSLIDTAGGFYYIDSAVGGKVLPTSIPGKFMVEFDEGYNTVNINGQEVELDENNSFMLTATSAATTTPADSDWIKVTYSYKQDIPAGSDSFTLDAGTNGGNISGAATKVVEITAGGSYTSDVTVTAPDGLQFIGWSKDKDDYVGELTITPEKGDVYYAIFGEVIYVGGSPTDSTATQGTKANPYTGFSKSAISNFPFKTSARNCVAVLNGSVTLASISTWTTQANKRVYITGLDPTTGAQNETAVTVSQFALASGSTPVFGLGVYLDNLTIASAINDPHFYLRGSSNNFRIGTNVINNTSVIVIGGVNCNVASQYIEVGLDKVGTGNNHIRNVEDNQTVTGDSTIVINKGFWNKGDGGVHLRGNIGGNLSLVINGYTSGKALRVNTKLLYSAGAINYIFNNNTKSTIASYYMRLNCTAGEVNDDAVPTQGGFYYIDSGNGGKVLPTETAGKFKIEFDEGYNYVTVNGNEVTLDSDNCFTLTATDASVVTPTESDWVKVAYGYKQDTPPTGKLAFTLDAGTNGGTVLGSTTKEMYINEGETYTSNVIVGAPTGLQFIGWSKDKDAYVGELTFTPQNGTTYYAIFGEVIYVDGDIGKTPANGGTGTKDNPYLEFSASNITSFPFSKTTYKNCVVVLSGNVTIASVSNWSVQENRRVYITGLDPTTGIQNENAVTVAQFAMGQSGKSGVFGMGVILDNCTIVSASGAYNFYLRGGAKNFIIGKNVVNNHTGNMLIGGMDNTIASEYIEVGLNKGTYIQTATGSGIKITGDSTVVINNGYYDYGTGGVMFAGNVGGNLSLVVNNYTSGKALRVNTANLSSAASINYIFNNNTKSTIASYYMRLNCTAGEVNDDAVPTQGGFYYIDSGNGGKVLPTATAGKFKVEFDEGYNYIKVNGQKVTLDSDNCFTLTASAASVITPAENDWQKITYHYEGDVSNENIFTVPVNHVLDLSTVGVNFDNAGLVSGADIVWDAYSGSDAIISNGKLVVFAESEITLNATYGGEVACVTFAFAYGAETDLQVTRFAGDKMVVTPVQDENNAYTVTIEENENLVLKYGTLTLTVDGSVEKIVEATDVTGKAFKFTVATPEKMQLSADYTTLSTRNASVYPLGVQVRTATQGHTAGLRFITRFPQITGDGKGGTLNSNYSQVGVLIIPKILWSRDTLPTAQELKNEQVSMGKSNASNIFVKTLMSSTEAYSDVAALLVDIPEGMEDVEIVAIPYLIDTQGNVTFADGLLDNNGQFTTTSKENYSFVMSYNAMLQ